MNGLHRRWRGRGRGLGAEMPPAQIQFCVLTGHLRREAKLKIYSAVNLPSPALITGNAAAAELDSCYYTARQSNFSPELPPHAIDIESITHWGERKESLSLASYKKSQHITLSDFFSPPSHIQRFGKHSRLWQQKQIKSSLREMQNFDGLARHLCRLPFFVPFFSRLPISNLSPVLTTE